MSPKHSLFLSLGSILALVVGLAGCGRSDESATQGAASNEDKDGHHAHVAPHGGTLIEIGDHMFALELVHDAEEGRLTAYVLDAHAEKFVRIPAEGFEIVALVAGRRESLPMAAVANPVTGETIGDTSEFTGAAKWLKGKVAVDALIPALEIRGTAFKDIRFAFRSPAPAR